MVVADERLIFGAMLGVLAGCSAQAHPAPQAAPVLAQDAGVARAAAAPAAALPEASAPEPTPPALAKIAFRPAGTKLENVFAIEGALIVAEGPRAGRVVEDRVEWIGRLPDELARYGSYDLLAHTRLESVSGRWPDAVDGLYWLSWGRAWTSVYFPLTGKGVHHELGLGGELNHVAGLATLGETTLLAGFSLIEGDEIWPVRGPRLLRWMQGVEEAGCKPEELTWVHEGRRHAVSPEAFGATRAGTLVSIGRLCSARGYAAEIWPPEGGRSRIVDLARFWPKSGGLFPYIARGAGDELFVFAPGREPIVRYRNGTFEALPALPRPARNVFVSADGRLLHASDGRTIRRLQDGAWKVVARLAWPATFQTMAIHEGAIWGGSGDGVYKLVETQVPPLDDSCTSPFVYLYDVSPKNAKDYSFPETRKALASFADAPDITLVDFWEEDVRRLGVRVRSRTQGEALIRHVRSTMKDEDPVAMCYEPKNPRFIRPPGP
jgi:hypothetical protein